MEITKDQVRLIVDRDTALFQITPSQRGLAELDIMTIVRGVD
jgi:hypothetical protein